MCSFFFEFFSFHQFFLIPLILLPGTLADFFQNL